MWVCKNNSDLSIASKERRAEKKGKVVKQPWEAHALQICFSRQLLIPGDMGQRWNTNNVKYSSYRVPAGCHLHLVGQTTQCKTSASYVCTPAVDCSISHRERSETHQSIRGSWEQNTVSLFALNVANSPENAPWIRH